MQEITSSDWRIIRNVFRSGFASSFHFGVASINDDGSPHLTPIGSLVFSDMGRGIYFEEYPRTLTHNLKRDQRICVMALNASKWTFFRTMLRGKAAGPFGVRLYGTAGERREATPEEVTRFLRRVRPFRFLRGHRLLWGKLRTVRDVRFHAFEPVRIPQLGSAQWPAHAQGS